VQHLGTGRRKRAVARVILRTGDGKITVWRDYWDARTLFSQQPASWLPDVPRL